MSSKSSRPAPDDRAGVSGALTVEPGFVQCCHSKTHPSHDEANHCSSNSSSQLALHQVALAGQTSMWCCWPGPLDCFGLHSAFPGMLLFTVCIERTP